MTEASPSPLTAIIEESAESSLTAEAAQNVSDNLSTELMLAQDQLRSTTDEGEILALTASIATLRTDLKNSQLQEQTLAEQQQHQIQHQIEPTSPPLPPTPPSCPSSSSAGGGGGAVVGGGRVGPAAIMRLKTLQSWTAGCDTNICYDLFT